MGSILLSQEFQTNAPIFLLLFLMFVVMSSYIIYKIIKERQKRKWEKLQEQEQKKLEELFELLLLNATEGESTMNGKDIVNEALSGAAQTTPGTGRQKELAQMLGQGFQHLKDQTTGMIRLARQVAVSQALQDEMQVGAQMVQGMVEAVEVENARFTTEAAEHVQVALGGAPSVQEEASASPQPQLQTSDDLDWAREIVRHTPYLAQETRTRLGGAALNVAFDFTPELKTALFEKLQQQNRSGSLSDDLQKLLDFLEQQ